MKKGMKAVSPSVVGVIDYTVNNSYLWQETAEVYGHGGHSAWLCF